MEILVTLPGEVVQQFEDVGEDAHGGDVGAGAGTLNDERRIVIPLGGEDDDVVASTTLISEGYDLV